MEGGEMVHPLRAWRMRHNLSLERLGKLAAISGPYVSQLESGAKVPSLVMAARLCEVTGLELRDFVPPEEMAEIKATYRQ